MIGMNYTKMYEALQKVLKDEQISTVMSTQRTDLVELWGQIYSGDAPWLNKETENAGVAASVSAEVARLITIELDSCIDGSPMAEQLDQIYQKVIGKLRVQIEYALAKGSMIFKPYMTDKGLAIQYLQADDFFPLDFDGEEITRCAFLDQFRQGNAIYTRIEIHSIKDGTLHIKNRAFVSKNDGVLGSEINLADVDKWAVLKEEEAFPGCNKLPFGYFVVPIGNTADSKSPLGASTFSRALPKLMRADKLYSQIGWEYESKETAVHISDSLLQHDSQSRKPIYPEGHERLYRTFEYDAGINDKPLMDVFSPPIRDAAYFNAWNQLMRQIEFDCFLAYGTLSDPNNTDKTATEIESSKQRSYSYVHSCQEALQKALEDLVDAMAFWCQVYDTIPAGELHMHFAWDDSIIVDKEQERQTARADIAMGAMSVIEYRMRYYGETEEEAAAAIAKINTSDDGVMK